MPPAPSQNVLHEAALAYLTNRSSSVALMKKVLARRIDAWSRRASKAADADEEAIERDAERSRGFADAVVERLLASGLLNDAQYAKSRAERLTRAGKSRRAVTFDLAQKGVRESDVRDALPHDTTTELAAAVALMRKKRLGPFAKTDDQALARERHSPLQTRWLGALARAGFGFSTAQRALRLEREEADDLLRGLR